MAVDQHPRALHGLLAKRQLGQLLGREVGRLAGGGELFYLLLAVDVGEGGGDLGGGEDELEGGLAQGALAEVGAQLRDQLVAGGALGDGTVMSTAEVYKE